MNTHIPNKKQNGFTMISVLVTTALVSILLPTLYRISMIPIIAQAKAANFQVAELAATSFVASSLKAQQVGPTPNKCKVTNEDEDELVYTISCTAGSHPSVVATAARTFNLNIAGTFSGLGVYSDDDRDGFDDVTGLFTHYAECYSGWKGLGSLKNNCELGGQYVIPAYAHLYI